MRTNNIFSTKKWLYLFLIGAVGFTGCKKFLDVNQNPNNPSSADPTLLLPTVEAALGQAIGNSLQITGSFYAQYWTQSTFSSQYKTTDRYALRNSDFDTPWRILYQSALINTQLIIDNKSAGSDVKGIAYLLKAYGFQITTDAFGDIPLTQALKGVTNGSPKYDTQQAVYDSVFNYIDKGVALLKIPNTLTPIGTQDMVFQGDVAKWIAFANTLKLKAYLRISGKDAAKATAGIAALYQSKPVFLTNDAQMSYNSIGGNENPLYNEMASPILGKTQNLVASATAVNAMVRNNDPRLFKFYDPLAGEDTIATIPQGGYLSNPNKEVSLPTALVAGNPQLNASALAPVKFISISESYFLQAEAVARGFAAGDVNSLFTNGINASFIATGLTSGDAATYITGAPDAKLTGPQDTIVKRIITQKYYAMNGTQGFEAWTEFRRTGYPTFFTVSKVSILGPGLRPVRFLYPNTELVSNLNFPGTVPSTTPVWWATK
ncbi:SusD/RagB family nutrient-binding outer membrane lipoprotein [Mucilaginibacter sp. 22184]|uniref:SusD/RagB family nutrient-binding outer membrane lipoprotein n=1 Tax=Mucilaginibacter sp. 22184 TaxID=3453887 RepID=UPI003F878D5C